MVREQETASSRLVEARLDYLVNVRHYSIELLRSAMVHHGLMRSKRILVWVTLAAGGVAVALLGVFLVVAGLDDADKWASVFGLFVSLAGLGLSAYGLVNTHRLRAGQTVASSIVGGGVTQVRRVKGNLRLTERSAVSSAAPSDAPPQSPLGGDGSGQTVSSTWTAGSVAQVHDVGGDAEVRR